MMKRPDIIKKIPKDKGAILDLWKKAELSYEHTKKLRGEERIYSNSIMRKVMNEILGFAMDNYGSDSRKLGLDLQVATSFGEFWDFLHWWLKDVGIDRDKWNEQEEFFHKNKKQ